MPDVSIGMYICWDRCSSWFRLFLSHRFHHDGEALEIVYLWIFLVYLKTVFHSQCRHLSHLLKVLVFLTPQYLKKFNHISRLFFFILVNNSSENQYILINAFFKVIFPQSYYIALNNFWKNQLQFTEMQSLTGELLNLNILNTLYHTSHFAFKRISEHF